MDMKTLQADWEALAGRRVEFTQGFYQRLFAYHPRYRELFPEEMNVQTDKMVEMFSGLVRFADHSDLIHPYLHNVGFAHRRLGIDAGDVENFKEVFIESLAELCAPAWDQRHERAWREAFDQMIVPLFDEGLETGRRKQSA